MNEILFINIDPNDVGYVALELIRIQKRRGWLGQEEEKLKQYEVKLKNHFPMFLNEIGSDDPDLDMDAGFPTFNKMMEQGAAAND